MTQPSRIAAVDIDGNSHAVDIAELSWRPSVYGIVIHEGSILMSPQHGTGYDLPGGGIDMHETIEQALIREVKEETGLDVAAGELAGVHDNFFIWKPDDIDRRQPMHSLLLYYVCELKGGEISTDGFDEQELVYAEEAVWMPLEQLPTLELASSYDFRELIYRHLESV